MTVEKQIARAIKRIESRVSNVEERREPDAALQLIREPEDGVQTAIATDDPNVTVGDAAAAVFDEDGFDEAEFQ